ncbi:SWI/SNF and RSC complex subunit Ssr3 [Saitoella coloradoensis]
MIPAGARPPQHTVPGYQRRRGPPGPPPGPPRQPSGPTRLKKPLLRDVPKRIAEVVPNVEEYSNLRDVERRLDAVMMRKRGDLGEAIDTPRRTKQTLRVFISNTASDQPWQATDQLDTNAFDFETGAIPSWTLKIEGRVLEEESKKFSDVVRSVVVDIERSRDLYPDGNVIEWQQNPNLAQRGPAFDALEIKRKGDTDCPVRIHIHPLLLAEKYKIHPSLANVIDMREGNMPEIVMALWRYAKFHNLQDPEELRMINCDMVLKHLFGVDRITFADLTQALRPLTNCPADPITLTYTVKVDQETTMAPTAFDIEIETYDNESTKEMSSLLSGLSTPDPKILELDDRISVLIGALDANRLKRQFFLEFSKDPTNYLKRWIDAQSRDLEVVLGDRAVDEEESRKSDFYQKEWMDESVWHYLAAQTQKKVQEILAAQQTMGAPSAGGRR